MEPTLSPTPILHVVQPGEILMNIAAEYGVSVEAIQAANGIADPRFLQVGQVLIIPTGPMSGAPSNLLLPTPTPLASTVQGVALYETPVGSLWCLGEVVNTANVAVTNVQVQVTLFDGTGASVAVADVFADAEYIPPGGRSPFRVLFADPPTGWAQAQAVILRSEAVGALAGSYVPIAVEDVVAEPAGPQLRVSGVVRHAGGEQSAGEVAVIVTAYDAHGSVTGVRQGDVEVGGALAPGASASFSLLMSFYGEVPADLAVTAVGRVAE